MDILTSGYGNIPTKRAKPAKGQAKAAESFQLPKWVLWSMACSTCVSFSFFAVFVLFRETERLWENWLITKTVRQHVIVIGGRFGMQANLVLADP